MDFQSFKNKYEKVPVEEYPNKCNVKPLLSVCIFTFNQEKFIRRCIDGALQQQTNFDYEIVLGDDDSNDGTREICLEYAKKFPDKIRLLLHHRDNNIKINGYPTGRFNVLYGYYSSKGKYIAICEGDDYWTDPLKLQKQVDFLEGNQEYSLCFHKTKVVYENTGDVLFVPELGNSGEYSVEQLIFKNYIQTCSVVFKNVIKNLPEDFYKLPMGDWPLFLLLSNYGKLYYLRDVMAVYNNHPNGVWNSKSNSDRSKGRDKLYKFIKPRINPHLGSLVEEARINNYDLMIRELIQENKIKEACTAKLLGHPSIWKKLTGWSVLRDPIKNELIKQVKSILS